MSGRKLGGCHNNKNNIVLYLTDLSKNHLSKSLGFVYNMFLHPEYTYARYMKENKFAKFILNSSTDFSLILSEDSHESKNSINALDDFKIESKYEGYGLNQDVKIKFGIGKGRIHSGKFYLKAHNLLETLNQKGLLNKQLNKVDFIEFVKHVFSEEIKLVKRTRKRSITYAQSIVNFLSEKGYVNDKDGVISTLLSKDIHITTSFFPPTDFGKIWQWYIKGIGGYQYVKNKTKIEEFESTFLDNLATNVLDLFVTFPTFTTRTHRFDYGFSTGFEYDKRIVPKKRISHGFSFDFEALDLHYKNTKEKFADDGATTRSPEAINVTVFKYANMTFSHFVNYFFNARRYLQFSHTLKGSPQFLKDSYNYELNTGSKAKSTIEGHQIVFEYGLSIRPVWRLKRHMFFSTGLTLSLNYLVPFKFSNNKNEFVNFSDPFLDNKLIELLEKKRFTYNVAINTSLDFVF